MDYNGKLVLAPMVRVGTQPMRLLAAGYGADIVYTEEIVDKRVVASVRVENQALGTIDYLDKGGAEGGRVMFRTTADERPRLVFQLGTADAATALAAAQAVAADVSTIDVNMGCPKQFSLQGGMGAALLRAPETAEDILKTLRRNLNIPVSCKIRLLDDPRDTVELARRLSACGIAALAVHGRTTQQRPREPAAWEPIKQVVDSLPGVPVIANGDIYSYADAQRVRAETGCAAAMLARGAMLNASAFRPEGFLPLEAVQREYGRLSLRWANALPNSAYCLKETANAPLTFAGRAGGPRALVGHEGNTAITRAKDAAALCTLLGIASTAPYQDLDDDTAAALRATLGAPNGANGKQQQQGKKQKQKGSNPGAGGAPSNRNGHKQPKGANGGQPAAHPSKEGDSTHGEEGNAALKRSRDDEAAEQRSERHVRQATEGADALQQ